ncbi:TPA: hypothetical protein DIV55_06355 [Patescibacteria group bacterium]|uniref:Uncharacterized protein n=1 Tax=Candidatus Gottesmanbacteria bacterium GW2011_GWA1_43_11 TaxID=1618436 RepID=A0A0G1CGZ2_9BACT|nr:MAG: hypothetical protein UV59_C0011G0036 [Candidatus Gottesmanbacteria bacterium GW2011_GWA1_43_11]HCS79329.1 hypothetical protein [Patescibacteria group bacterium]
MIVENGFTQENITRAFAAGYHSENLPATSHSTHKLMVDAQQIAMHLESDHVQAVYDALVNGVSVEPYPQVEAQLFNFKQAGDTICIWTQGDPKAQVAKVRNLGWETTLRNQRDPGNFILYAGEEKSQLLPSIIEYSQRRQSESVFILDDKIDNLTTAQNILSAEPTPITYVLMDQEHRHEALENVQVVHSIAEYAALVQKRSGDGTITHIIDLDGTLINPDNSRASRLQALTDTLLNGTEFTLNPRPRFHQLNGISVIDHDHIFPKGLINWVPSEAEFDFSGHQADIYMLRDGRLAKVFARHDKHRPQTPEWQTMGGYRGAIELKNLMQTYHDRLYATGFPVPQDRTFLLGEESGQFFVVEIVEQLGDNLQDDLLNANYGDKRNIVNAILEASYPVLVDDGIGADVKPANFVHHPDGGITHIDPAPVIMADSETGRIYTEWPIISELQIQDFLYKTHLTPAAIGYRFYQEIGQLDPENRSFYQQVIREKLAEWVAEDKMDEATVSDINEAMEPHSSKILARYLRGGLSAQTAQADIEQYINMLSQPGSHPIYALREMAFLLTERILETDAGIESVTNQALQIVRKSFDAATADKIRAQLEKIPTKLHFLTVIRRLTHLSHTDWVAGPGETVALRCILEVSDRYATKD